MNQKSQTLRRVSPRGLEGLRREPVGSIDHKCYCLKTLRAHLPQTRVTSFTFFLGNSELFYPLTTPAGGRSREVSRWKRLWGWVSRWRRLWVILVISPPSLQPRNILFLFRFWHNLPMASQSEGGLFESCHARFFLFLSSWNGSILSPTLSCSLIPSCFFQFPLITQSYLALCAILTPFTYFTVSLSSAHSAKV